MLNALKADPRTVDLRALAPHFYNLGARILELFDEEEMIEVLSDVRPRSYPPYTLVFLPFLRVLFPVADG